PQMSHRGSKVTRRCKPIRGDFSLNGEIPRLRGGCSQIVGLSEEKSDRRESHILVDDVRKWISTWNSLPRIVEASRYACQRCAIAPRGHAGIALTKIARHKGVAVAVCGAYRAASVAGRVPRKAESRRQLEPPIVNAGVGGETWVADEVHS